MNLDLGVKSFTKINIQLIEEIKSLIPNCFILFDEESLKKYSHDETEDLVYYPELIVIPTLPEEIQILFRWCNQNYIPITPRGAGTGLSGGSLPIFGGVILSMEKFNKILKIDERNQQAIVEAGVITQILMDEAEKVGLYYPIDPSSKGSCYLGSNVAHGSGGPRVVKYGTLRDYVLNLEVVLTNGDIIWTGSNTLKFASGYNLTQLMIGSEGTLAVITKVVVKLIPKPKTNLLLMVGFESPEKACMAVSLLFKNGFTPSALEFMEKSGIEWVIKFDKLNFIIEAGTEAYLLIELDGEHLDYLQIQAEQISELLYDFGCKEILLADTASQKEDWWRMRRKMAESVKANSIYKEEDTVVPRAELGKLISGIKKIGLAYGFTSICYGHAGDGNLHINIIKGNLSDKTWEIDLPEAIREIFKLTVQLGGTISGEHGIGLVQKKYMGIAFSEVHLNLQREIKRVFDPLGILNPGKIFNNMP